MCRRIRADGRTIPVLILTARADEVDTVVGLDAGADDYVTKPFRLAELLARVRALLRRRPNDAGPSSAVVRIDPEARRAFFNEEELQLTAKEFDLLRVLVREQGKVVSREQLMREIWDTAWFGSTKTLDMHISVLRRKLGDDAAQPRSSRRSAASGSASSAATRADGGAPAAGAVHRARGGPVGHHRRAAAVPRRRRMP